MGSFRAIVAVALAGSSATAMSAPEEIVVFDDGFEAVGKVGRELHINYAARSRTTADHPGEQPPGRVLRVMPEVVWGLSPTWNIGLHVPLSYSRQTQRATLDGMKLRFTNLHVNPAQGGGTWFYGANYELSVYDKRLSEARVVGELRGIGGRRFGDWLVAVNPILNKPLSSEAGIDRQTHLAGC